MQEQRVMRPKYRVLLRSNRDHWDGDVLTCGEGWSDHYFLFMAKLAQWCWGRKHVAGRRFYSKIEEIL